jgi:hypothetical protein
MSATSDAFCRVVSEINRPIHRANELARVRLLTRSGAPIGTQGPFLGAIDLAQSDWAAPPLQRALVWKEERT